MQIYSRSKTQVQVILQKIILSLIIDMYDMQTNLSPSQL